MCLEKDFRGAVLVTKKFLLFYIKLSILNIFLLVTTNKTCTFSRKIVFYYDNFVLFLLSFSTSHTALDVILLKSGILFDAYFMQKKKKDQFYRN